MNISSVDLNLLVCFEAMIEERNVSRAARRIGLSQPAMSSALGRLRTLFGDPLFQRTGRGMTPTPRAMQLVRPIRNGLAELRTALAGPPAFDPVTSERSFRVAMNDYAEMLLGGPLLDTLQRNAPGLQLLVRRLDQIFVAPEADLRAGTFDAAIGFFSDASALDSATHVRDLFSEQNVCLGRRGNPLFRHVLTAARFASAPQVGVFYRAESRGLIDNVLAAQGLRRHLQATTPHFLTVPYLVAASDLIASVPEGLALSFRRVLPLTSRKLPIDLPPLRMRLVWHEHAHDDPAQQWLREQIIRCASAGARRPPAAR